jgi:molybdenum cofactor biosynthesis enzyme MoaA
MQLSRKSTNLEKLLTEANTRADMTERARAKAAADKKATLTKIRCLICYHKGLETMTSCDHEFCRKCHDDHFQISPGGDPDIGFY